MFNHPLKNTAAWAVQHWHQKRNVVLQEKEIVTASNYKLDVIIRIQWKIDPRFTGICLSFNIKLLKMVLFSTINNNLSYYRSYQFGGTSKCSN